LLGKRGTGILPVFHGRNAHAARMVQELYKGMREAPT